MITPPSCPASMPPPPWWLSPQAARSKRPVVPTTKPSSGDFDMAASLPDHALDGAGRRSHDRPLSNAPTSRDALRGSLAGPALGARQRPARVDARRPHRTGAQLPDVVPRRVAAREARQDGARPLLRAP